MALFLIGYRIDRESLLYLIKICLAIFIDCGKKFTPTHNKSYDSSSMVFRIVKAQESMKYTFPYSILHIRLWLRIIDVALLGITIIVFLNQ